MQHKLIIICTFGLLLALSCTPKTETTNAEGWNFSGLAATAVVDNYTPATPAKHIYWGDLHNHNNVTYGHGDLKDALEAAREQLDFVATTPHALWPDIPGANDPRLNWVIGYHTGAFERLRAGGYEPFREMTNSYNQEGKFLTFIGYECHSMAHGDHVALFYDQDAPLLECTSIPDLKRQLRGRKAFLTPHHMGYIEGYRGYYWDAFEQGAMTPFVEMFSRHGLAESDLGDYQYLHDMGPRRYQGTVQYGLEQGYKFAIIGSTDQHAGYPGSYGDGRVAVLADSLLRNQIWNGLEHRHAYCATGDKIAIDFRVNDSIMGSELTANKRTIYVKVEGQNFIDYVDLIKNNQCIARMSGPYSANIPQNDPVRAKVKVEFGWNREDATVHWQGAIKLSEGKLLSVTPCFRGAAYTSPQPGQADTFKTTVNRVVSKTDNSVALDMYSSKNPNTLTPATQAVILEVEMHRTATITADFNGQQFSHSLGELLEGSKAHFMIGWLSQAILFNRAAPMSAYTIERTMVDDSPVRPTDYYYIRVRQRDNQWAWSTPIWVDKK